MNNEIKKVEQRLEKAIKSKDSVLEQASLHLLSSGGKRVRPAFVILSSQFGKDEQTSEQTYQVAVALELIHMATLVHDDVIDKSDKRRGKLTISKKWDQTTAILTGNFLLALGLEHLMAVKDNRVHQLISESIVDVCRGELFQFQDQFNSQQTIINYLRRINRKTALLIQISTEVGAITSQSDKETVRKLKMIGHYIGMSFQIIDDVLDFTSTEKKLGKPVGSDLLNGHITLPILLEMRKNPDFIRSLGIYLLGIVWVLQTISLSIFIIQTRHIPLGSISDVFYTLSWLIISISLILNLIKVLNFSVFFLNLIGLTLLGMNTFQPTHYTNKVQKIAVVDELLLVHIGLAVLSYVFFALAFVNALLYIMQYRNLKEKRFDQKYFRIGSVATLESIVFYSTLSGWIILIFSIILGTQWGVISVGERIFIDPKVILSSIITVLYGSYILLRINKWLNSRYLIYYNIILFCLNMINLFFATHFVN